MTHLPPINPHPEQGQEHHTCERFARDEMLAILRVGTPTPLRDLPVDASRVIVLPNPIDVYIDPSQPRVEYQLCEMTETPVAEAEAVKGDWDLAEMKSPELKERKSFALRAGRNWCRNDLTGIYMQDNRRGWIRGDGIVLYTDDGGSHWRILASGRELHHLPRQLRKTETAEDAPDLSKQFRDAFQGRPLQLTSAWRFLASGQELYPLHQNTSEDKPDTDWQYQDAIEAAPWRPAQAPATDLDWSSDNQGVQSIGDIQINALQSIEKNGVGEEWAVGDEGHIFYRKNGGDWLPQQSFVFLHDRINVRLGIDTRLGVSWRPNTEATHERVVSFHADYPAVYVHRSQLKVRYRLMAAQETTAEVLSDWVEGTGDTIQIPFMELPPLEEDLTVYIQAKSFDVPIIYEEWMEAALQLYVQPNPDIKVALRERVIDYGAHPEVVLDGRLQASVTYHLHAYIPPFGEYLPDEPFAPTFTETEHPQLAESYYHRATILRQLHRYEEAKAFVSTAIALHEQLTYPLDPSRIDAYRYEQKWIDEGLEKQAPIDAEREEQARGDGYRKKKTRSKCAPKQETPEPTVYDLEIPFATIPPGFENYLRRSGAEADENELVLQPPLAWEEDSYFLVEAKKTEGKGGSIWLDPMLLLRVRPRIDDLDIRLLWGEATNWQAPLVLQIRNSQFGVGYQLIDPKSKPIDSKGEPIGLEYERPAILPLEDAEWAIGWWFREHLFGRKVGFNFIVGEPPYEDPYREPSHVRRAAGTDAAIRALGWPGYERFFGMRVGVDYVIGEWTPNQPRLRIGQIGLPWSELGGDIQRIVRRKENLYFKMKIGDNFIVGTLSEQEGPILDSVLLLSGSVPTERSVATIQAVKAYSGLTATTVRYLDPPSSNDAEE